MNEEPTFDPAVVEEIVHAAIRKEQRRFLAAVVIAIGLTLLVYGYGIRFESHLEERVSGHITDLEGVHEKLDAAKQQILEQIPTFEYYKEYFEEVDRDETFVALKEQIATFNRLLAESPDIKIALDNVYVVDKRLREIERQNQKITQAFQVLSLDTGDSLTLPMIRRDLVELQEEVERLNRETEEELDSVKRIFAEDVGRIYDLVKWFIGMILAVTLIPILEPIVGKWGSSRTGRRKEKKIDVDEEDQAK